MHLFDIIPLIQTIGLLGVILFVFAESGLFFGFFLPGDSLLFTAGILSAAGYMDITALFAGCLIAAILGDTVGYWTGKKLGPRIFSKPNSFFWNKTNLERTELFFEKHGNKTITLARFVPIIRTFAPIFAGVGKMQYKTFLFWNVFGALLWTGSMILGGYFLGNAIPDIDKYILPIVAFIIILSLVPIIVEFFKGRVERKIRIEESSTEKSDGV